MQEFLASIATPNPHIKRYVPKPLISRIEYMARTCDCTFNRKALLSSEIAVCFYCFHQYPPSEITEWCDGEDLSQTAICPYCSVDSVVGFNGSIDTKWVKERNKRSFG
jgi:hypothetical protein